MNKNFYVQWAMVLLLLLSYSFCFGPRAEVRATGPGAYQDNFRVSETKAPRNYARLLEKLRLQRAQVKSSKERVRQPFFLVSGRIIQVNNEHIQVFEYSNPATAESQAKLVSPDGRTIGNSKPSWMATPHFFKSQKLIVIYIGDDKTVLKILQGALGDQFAGG
jgi:hypothetical protein